MDSKLKHLTFFVTLLAFHLIPTVVSKSKIIPSDSSLLDEWIACNMKQFNKRKAELARGKQTYTLDNRLAKAEDFARIIRVRKNGIRDFDTITDAVNSIPLDNTHRVIIWIGGGQYCEKITINCSRPFVTFYGDPDDMPAIVYNGTAQEFGTVNSATVAVESDYFMAVNIMFVNSAPMPDGIRENQQAVAMRISGDKAAFHNCKFIGYQDTLCDDRGKHFFKDCYVQGTVDFIFGNGKSLYLNTTIHSVAEGTGVITAQARENVTDESGFTFVYCNITGTGNTYLGRAWKQRPRVVFAYTNMGTLINSEGWSDEMQNERDKFVPKRSVYYGEYNCTGPGASSSGRAEYAKILTDEEAKPFLSMTYIKGNKWVLIPPKF